MKQVMNVYRKRNLDKQRLAVLRLELNYELAVLFEALQEKDEQKQKDTKLKLEKIREELLRLEANEENRKKLWATVCVENVVCVLFSILEQWNIAYIISFGEVAAAILLVMAGYMKSYSLKGKEETL